eukprot:767804-Hanusia_phi.AAC.13
MWQSDDTRKTCTEADMGTEGQEADGSNDSIMEDKPTNEFGQSEAGEQSLNQSHMQGEKLQELIEENERRAVKRCSIGRGALTSEQMFRKIQKALMEGERKRAREFRSEREKAQVCPCPFDLLHDCRRGVSGGGEKGARGSSEEVEDLPWDDAG